LLWIGSLPLIIAALISDKPWTQNWNLAGILWLLIMGATSSGLAYVIYAVLIHRSGPVFTSISNFISPLVGVLLGVGLRGEYFGLKEVLALILILGALAIYELDIFSKRS
jgi:drug/metabolite transporter (DMT)-like permease